MAPRLAVLSAAVLIAAAAAPAASAGPPPFRATISEIGPRLAKRMTGVSWHPGCPVAIRDLRVLRVRRIGFDGRVRSGRLVVHEDVAADVVRVFRRLYRLRFPIRKLRLIEAYGGSDFRSIEDDNTSAFNCRRATGSGAWSNHAYGLAIDLNPIENPYVENGRVYHATSRRYVDRSRRRKGMVLARDAVVRAFAAIGWGWGGSWPGRVKDYQHFSVNGR